MMLSHLEPKYLVRVEKLAQLNSAAYSFLKRLASEQPAHPLHLSTATNAHVYKGAAYLMHIAVQGPKREPNSIVLSPTLHIMIEQGAVDRSELLFPRTVRDLVMSHGGFKAGWALSPTHVDITLRPNTPNAFFGALFELLCSLAVGSCE